MQLLNIWKPKNSRMCSVEYISFDEKNIVLNLKMNNVFENINSENLLFLLNNRWNEEKIILKPLQISASNNEIFIKVVIEKANFNSEGLWDAFITLEDEGELFRVYDDKTPKMQVNQTLIKEKDLNVIFYSTIKGNLSFHIKKQEPCFVAGKMVLVDKSILSIEGIILGYDFKRKGLPKKSIIIFENDENQSYVQEFTINEEKDKTYFKILLDLNKIIEKFESANLNIYIESEFLQGGTQFTSSLIKNNNATFNEIISLNGYEILLSDYQQKKQSIIQFSVQKINNHFEVDKLRFPNTKSLEVKGEVFPQKNDEVLENIILKKRSSNEIVSVSINKNQPNLIINLDELISNNKIGLGIWDTFVESKFNIYPISKLLDEIKNKQKVFNYPQHFINSNTQELLAVKPYYTIHNNLSLLIRKAATQKKITKFRIIKDTFYLDGLINIQNSFTNDLSGKYIANIHFSLPKGKELTLSGNIKINKTMKTPFEYSFEFVSDPRTKTELETILVNINFDLSTLQVQLTNNQYFNIQLNIDPEKASSSTPVRSIKINNTIKRLFLKNKNLVYNILNKILPIDKKMIIYQSFHGKSYSCNPKAIYEKMVDLHGSNYKNIWVLNNIHKPLKEKNTVIVKPNSLMYYFYMARSKYFINNGNFPDFYKKRKKTVHIQTWHGTPLKKLGFDISPESPSYKENTSAELIRRNKRWDFAISPNSFTSSVYSSAFQFDKEIIESGYPRNDIFYQTNKDNIIKCTKEELNIPVNKKVILYAPTWRDDDFHNKKQNEPYEFKFGLERFVEEFGDEYVLLVRLHYRDAIRAQVSDYKGVIYNVSNYDDIKYLYLISDILITDYSSVMFDFANTRKPMIFFAYDINKYSSELRGFYFDFKREAPGPIITNEKDLYKAIKNINQYSFLYKNNYNCFADKYCKYDNGKASEEVIKRIFEIG
ncbi:CDP-glycerol glycerophosphotransferase family protein [Bacillus velezensis]|uniref:CDP-glycerol glycerophosphotransferase family protein n=2 Tax=Bacillus subtilis group TaxID=653685 RepID=UPI001049916C|nr:CDP-glycerol glycerophosphotransferase family protein [Bacillus amyloliquefaciens]QOH67855.1 CDP-glycerol glycerophosphotransferase family protein [Bacillus amyloliquefaciens]